MKSKLVIFFLVILLFLGGLSIWFSALAPVSGGGSLRVVAIKNDLPADGLAKVVAASKLVRNEAVLGWILQWWGPLRNFPAGGYEAKGSMNVFEVADSLFSGPQLLWVVVPPGWRKEQIADKLQVKFRWTDKNTKDFLSFAEGEYFPDTYLIPRADSGKQVAERMHNRFNEEFAPYAAKFLVANIKSDTALKIASLLQRESGGDDMSLIAGIIWNRLDRGMGLKIDATIQYAKGKVGDYWWGPVSVSDYSAVDSPYNSYLYKGLPPTPIASSGLAAIDAVLNSAQTDCLYYLHDPTGQIHCSATYEGHLANIEKYLK